MSINRIIYSVTLTCALISGCGGGEELKVSIEGEGLVTSSPAGILCGLGNTQCSAKFTQAPVVLTATAPDDGRTSFLRWGGDCSGDAPVCSLTKASAVTAEFISTDIAKNLPTKPSDFRVSAMGSSVFLVQWNASQDSMTARENLKYKIYVSTDEASLLADTSIAVVLNGTQEERYSYDLDVGALGLLSDSATYHVAIIAVDDDGYESKASSAANLELITEELQLRTDIVIRAAEELGLPAPTTIAVGDELEYVYANVPATISVSEGSYIAQLVKEDGVEYHELLKVVAVTNGGFRAVVAPLIDVTATPYTLSGSATLDADDQIESETPAQDLRLPAGGPPDTDVELPAEGALSPQSVLPDERQILKPFSSPACTSPENIGKVSISADAGMKRGLRYRLKVFTETACSHPDLCNASDNFVRFSADINGSQPEQPSI